MTRVARVMLPCLLALLLGALLLAPPPTRAETQPASDKTYDAPPALRDTGRLLRDLFKQERCADFYRYLRTQLRLRHQRRPCLCCAREIEV